LQSAIHVRGREYGVHAGHGERGGSVYAADAGMRVAGPHERRVQHPGQADIVDEFAAPGKQALILAPSYACADGFSAQDAPRLFGPRRQPGRHRGGAIYPQPQSVVQNDESRLAGIMSVDVQSGGTLLCGDAVERGADGRAVLIGGACRDCGNQTFPRAPVCCICMSENIAAQPMPRAGTLYAFSTVHVTAKKWKKPMCIGYVDLSNGARVFTHLEGELAIGDTLEVAIAIVGEDENGPIESFVFKRGAS
jgi:uncharacterized OB-fold protein